MGKIGQKKGNNMVLQERTKVYIQKAWVQILAMVLARKFPKEITESSSA